MVARSSGGNPVNSWQQRMVPVRPVSLRLAGRGVVGIGEIKGYASRERCRAENSGGPCPPLKIILILVIVLLLLLVLSLSKTIGMNGENEKDYKKENEVWADEAIYPLRNNPCAALFFFAQCYANG